MIDGATAPGTTGKVLIGGKIDKDSLYLPPTVIVNPAKGSKILEEEIFGPILPIIPFVNFDEVVDDHIKKREKPLAIYYFGHSNSQNFQRIIDSTSSGSVTANDILTQVLAVDLGFGGVGGSGYGRVGGYEGFK